jgi:putative transcriptional regulator
VRGPKRSPVATSADTADATLAVHPVRAARTEAGFTQQSLADAVGVTRQTIISMESGDYAPSVVLAIRVARCCSTTVEALWGAAADAAEANS